MRKIRSYLLFTSMIFRIGVLIVFPLLLLIFTVVFVELVPLGTSNTVNISLFVLAEVFLDFWVFGGICSKNFNGVEYMKSSLRGKQVMLDALLIDCLRKLIWLAVIVFGSDLVYLIIGDINLRDISFLYQIILVLFGHGSVMIGNVLVRYTSFYPVAMFISCGACVLVSVFVYLSFVLPVPMLVLSVLCSVGFSGLSIWNVMRKMEEGYYD